MFGNMPEITAPGAISNIENSASRPSASAVTSPISTASRKCAMKKFRNMPNRMHAPASTPPATFAGIAGWLR